MVSRNPEYYPERQGRPASKLSQDLESRRVLGSPSKPVGVVDNKPVNGHTNSPISSDWAYDYVKEQEEKDELKDLETAYNTMMIGERHTSNRRGYEQR